ncbi:MAG: hypothetical protein U0746_16085 [Gemmataceae bacterium]
MERRPYPSYDCVTIRRMAAGFVGAMLSILVPGMAVAAGAQPWVLHVGIAGFLAASVWVVRTPVNRCRCPTCGDPLARPADTTEFPCGRCGIVWVTRVYGESVLE